MVLRRGCCADGNVVWCVADQAIEAYQKAQMEHHDDKTKRLLQQLKDFKKKQAAKAYLSPELSTQVKERLENLLSELFL